MTGAAARVMDLFGDLDDLAAEYGWDHLGQPRDDLRRYGKAIGGLQVTLSAYANLPGTALTKVQRTTVSLTGERTRRVLGHLDGGKRDRMVKWIRFAEED